MKRTNYYLGGIFIFFIIFFWFFFNSAVQAALESLEMSSGQEPEQIIFDGDCDEDYENARISIERWWVSEGDKTIKSWDQEAETCKQLREEPAKDKCLARVNQMYYTILRTLPERREARIQIVEEVYRACKAQDQIVPNQP
ncbi:MAG: hypothetical protein ABIE75_01220 [Candidatus Omnitrophota bacterium]